MSEQFSMMDAVDAALPYGFPCGSWWWHAWKAGDFIPPGWRPPVPGADYPKPRLPAEASPGDTCENDEIDMEVAKGVDGWLPDGMESPFIGIHQTRRLACGAAWARLEAWDGGLSDATVRDGLIEWGHVPGAGALVALDGRWTRLPAEEAQDAHWKEPGDAIPPGYTPPIGGEVRPGGEASYGGVRDNEIVSDVLLILMGRWPPGIPFPWEDVVETHRFPDGAVWASLRAVHDGGLSHFTLRDGVLEWSEVPGTGLLTYVPQTRTWGRLPAKETWDVETQARVPKSSTPALAAASAPPDVEAPETLTSASPDVEALETSASDLPDVAPEPAAPAAGLQPSGGIAAFLHAGGSLTAPNAAALLARLDAAEPPAEVVTEVEFPDVDPVYGTRRAPLAQPNFREELLRRQAEGRAQKEMGLRPLRALADAGLAQLLGDFRRAQLLPPASDGLMLWYDPNYGRPKDVSLWITGPDVDPDILTRIEGILGVTAQGAATSIRLLK